MVNGSAGLDATFMALADPTRRGVIAALAQGEVSISDLARPYSMSLPAFLKHLRVLETSGIIEKRKEGRVNYCCLRGASLREADQWMGFQRQFWNNQLDSLGRYLDRRAEAQLKKKESASCPQQQQPSIPSKSNATTARRQKRSTAPSRRPKP